LQATAYFVNVSRWNRYAEPDPIPQQFWSLD
jgi:hypothetical protein